MKMTLPNFTISRKIVDLFSKIIPSSEGDHKKIKDDIWADLAAVYYKYDDNAQKIAFREVTREISNKLVQDNWDSIYKKLYQQEKVPKTFTFIVT